MEDKSLNINNKTENFMNFVKEKKKIINIYYYYCYIVGISNFLF